jgi:hypothetical protein
MLFNSFHVISCFSVRWCLSADRNPFHRRQPFLSGNGPPFQLFDGCFVHFAHPAEAVQLGIDLGVGAIRKPNQLPTSFGVAEA